MVLTDKQSKGLKIAIDRYRNHEKYTTISGYAGTGKSTLVRYIIDAIGINEDFVVYSAYTGKAVEVLRKKGNQNAMTLHHLLYDSIPKPGGGFFHIPKTTLDFSIVVVDEVSMVPKTMVNLLLKHNIYVIFLGDPFQLPQIDPTEKHDLLDKPHIFLDEVMRQAAESEIIQLTMAIRERREIPFKQGKEVLILRKKELTTGHLRWADQIICATNATKTAINNLVRDILGYSGLPKTGEKMICLRNYWDDFSTNGEASLVNGMTGVIKEPFESFRMAPFYLKMDNHKMETIIGNFETDDGNIFSSVEMDKRMILNGEKCINPKESYALSKLKNKIGDIVPREFAFGYCITGHKSQGSEYPKVLAVEENFPFEKTEHAKWLYTVCTRASDRLVLFR